jgi:signal transduction histidine kinase/ActR/RegA family two-component response regulator
MMLKQQSISKILNTRIAAVVICVNIIICILFFFFSVRLSEKEFQKTLNQQSEHLAGTFTQQLWLFDLNTTERLADLAYGSQDVSGIRLLDHEGHILVERGRMNQQAQYYVYTDLVHESGTSVGVLELEFADESQQKQRKDILFGSVAVIFITIILSFLLISRVIKRFLVRPLKELQDDMGALAAGQFRVSPQSGKTSEIQAIIDDFNAMSTSLALREDERQKAEEQQKKLENELRQRYKMEAVGLMAGGIAHNFNNNLAIILGNLELVQLKAGDNVNIADHLRDANIAVHRARDLTKQILTYSRQDTHDISQFKPAMIIDETVKLLRSTIPTTVKLNYSVPQDFAELTINGDSTRVQEALINLCNNAVQAMDETGELTITMTRRSLLPSEIPAHSQCQPGNYALLSVSDTGCGMSEEIVEKIFDPFFTTKAVDQGTGMGLSTVQGIVKQHKGFINVHSASGFGSTFDLFFPEAIAIPAQFPMDEEIKLPRGTERVLVVDDDELLADLGEMLLSNQGYKVVTETSSLAALELFKKNPDKFDVLMTDQTMPQMTGLELIRELKSIRPDLPTILCTGYSSKVSPEELDRLNVDAFCLKPLKLADLAHTIRNVLDDR